MHLPLPILPGPNRHMRLKAKRALYKQALVLPYSTHAISSTLKPPSPPLAQKTKLPPIPLLIPLMMQRNAIKLLKRIRQLPPRRRQPRIQRHALHLTRTDIEPLVHTPDSASAQIYAAALFDIAEVDRIDPAALVRDDGRFGMAEESPRGAAEEGVGFHVGGAGAGAESTEFVFDEEFANEGFAEAVSRSQYGFSIVFVEKPGCLLTC